MSPPSVGAAVVALVGAVVIGLGEPTLDLEASWGDVAHAVVLGVLPVAGLLSLGLGAWSGRLGLGGAGPAVAWFVTAVVATALLGESVLPAKSGELRGPALWADGGLCGAALGGWVTGMDRPAPRLPLPLRLALAAVTQHAAFWVTVLAFFGVIALTGMSDDSVLPFLLVALSLASVGTALAAVVAPGTVEPRHQQLAAVAAAAGLVAALPDKGWLVENIVQGDPVAIAVCTLPVLLTAVAAGGVALRARRSSAPP